MKRCFLLFLFLHFTLILCAENVRLFQLICEDDSYISLEAGIFSGIAIQAERMDLNLGYSFYGVEGPAIFTDLILLELPIVEFFNISTGFGGGLILQPKLNDFKSVAFIRVPIIFNYKDIYVNFIPMLGGTMFEYSFEWVPHFSLGMGYRFKLEKPKSRDNNNLNDSSSNYNKN